MEIHSLLKINGREELQVTYQDTDSFAAIPPGKISQSYAVCFYGDKLVIVKNGQKGTWGLVGGSIEIGESPEECLKREVGEESNMAVKNFRPIGFQTLTFQDRKVIHQLRYVCTVEPFGDFISDPAGSISEIKLIDPADYKEYFDWGEIGERIMERAIELKDKIK